MKIKHIKQKNKKLDNLPSIIDTFYKEHEIILSFLDRLEKIIQKIQEIEDYQTKNRDGEELRRIAEHLIGAEPHHQREEKVLFPKLQERELFGPPEAMRQEHKELRKYKHRLKELAKKVNKNNFANVKKELKVVSEFLVFNLRNHISKENDILYPMALQMIKEQELWQEMKTAADKIGYCCFTPKN